jgi:Ca-activated chloride channel family protein
MIEFLWPWVFVLLPLPLVVYLALRRAGNREPALHVPFFRTLNGLDSGVGRRGSRSGLALAVASMIWLALVLAASRPQWVGEPVQLPTTGRDLMLVIDVSGSMEAQDMSLGGQAVNRLQITKNVVGDFVARRTGDRLGLILFAARAYTQVPLTFDRATVETLLYEAQIGIIEENATAIGDGIGLAVKHLKERPNPSRVIIMLTDGVNNAGEVSPLQAGQLAAQEGIRIYTIGIGAETGVSSSLFGSRAINPSADLDEASLTKIAESTGGKYFRARDRDELENIYAVLDQLEPVDQDAKTFRPTIALFYWPLGVALALSLLLALVKLPWAQLRLERAPAAPPSAAVLGGKRA